MKTNQGNDVAFVGSFGFGKDHMLQKKIDGKFSKDETSKKKRARTHHAYTNVYNLWEL